MNAFSNGIVGRRHRYRRNDHHLNCNRFIYAYIIKVLMIICVLLINRCGFVKTIETTSILNIDGGHTKSGASQIRSMIFPSSTSKQQQQTPSVSPSPKQQQQQPKPSSVIYIPSLDDVNMASRLHSSEHDIRFEDFFWNGSGDGGEPLILSLKSNARLTAMSGFVGRETFIKTATVIATVYIDDSNENDGDPNCKWPDCVDGIPDIYLPPNKRFWLVTTVFGHLTDDDMPSLQQRIADMYRIAFAKQQSLHLGITNVTADGSNNANDTTSIIENKQSTNLSMPISPTSVLKYEYGQSNSTVSSASSSLISTSVQPNLSIDSTTAATSLLPSESSTTTMNSIKSIQTKMNVNQIDSHQSKKSASSISQLPKNANITATLTTTNIITATTINTFQPSQNNLQSTISAMNMSKSLQMHRNTKSTLTAMKNAENMHRSEFIGHINILIHNISVINLTDKNDYEKSEREWMESTVGQSISGSISGISALESNYSSDSLMTNDNQTQTEIVYTVFVNGVPVLAKIAANDVQLMSDAEVSTILDMGVHTKAEPYLKEPQATPLIPSSTVATDQNKPILAIIFQNPYILAFILVLILLIILLLMLLMLVSGTKNQQNIPKKGLTTTAAQTARQPPNLPTLPSSKMKRSSSSGHVSYADESHQYHANITNELLKRRQSGNNVQPEEQQQQQPHQHEHHHHHTTQKKKQAAGAQITSLHDSVDDGFAYHDERDHSFIIIPTPLKRRHHKKTGAPTIYFPEPPSSEPSLPPSPLHTQQTYGTSNSGSHSGSNSSSCSTSTTSDTSSIYYIKTHKSRRHHHLYAKRPQHITAVNHREYATITKKQIERAQKKSSKHKHHRKYLTGIGNGNRVGAFEAAIVQVHSSRSSSMATAAAAAAAAATSTSGQQNANEEYHHRLHRSSTLNDNFEMSTGKDSNLYEHIEAFNPMVGKKNIHNQFMSTKQQEDDQYGKKSSTIFNENEKHMQNKSLLIDRRQNEIDNVNHLRNGTTANSFMVVNAAIDKSEQQQQHQHTKQTDRISNQLSTDKLHDDDNDDDVGSVGSFLSMASVRSFPKCSVPEPLNRVLEPVSITYLDQYDEIEATEAATSASKLPRIVDAKEKKRSTSSIKPQPQSQPPQPQQPPPPPVRSCKQHEHPGTKQTSDEIVYLSRTRSDHHDPGVVGPIAWQYHKKRLEDQQNAKIHIDPVSTQHRYEDLVEGAISLYSIETTEYHTIETITKEEFPEVLIGNDMRGKSADVFPTPISTQSKTSPKPYRPFTAIPSKKTVVSAGTIAAEEPQITSKDAWAGSTSLHQSPNSEIISTQSDGEAIQSDPHNKLETEKQ